MVPGRYKTQGDASKGEGALLKLVQMQTISLGPYPKTMVRASDKARTCEKATNPSLVTTWMWRGRLRKERV